MSWVENIFHDDIAKYKYMMTDKEIIGYRGLKMSYTAMGIVLALMFMIYDHFSIQSFVAGLLMIAIGFKMPYNLLRLRHNRRCNDIVSAIPIWVNLIYSLIGENNIYNSIVLSYDLAPICMKLDLLEFIEKIEINNSDRDAYLNFLSRYSVDGFRDIMMKIYEFRNLSKDKLKYEITVLNKSLSEIEKMKREQRYKGELFVVDMINTIMVGVPCLYMFYISMLLSDLMM